MKTLVTGGTGFIGGHVVKLLLENGHFVRLFSRNPEMPERFRGEGAEVFRGDLREPDSVIEAMEGIEVFYHIGEIKNLTPGASEKNLRLIGKITASLGQMKVRRLVFVSSISVGGIPSEIPANEDSTLSAVLKDYYTSYKRESEKLIVQTCTCPEYVIVRPAPVYGPGSRYLGRLITAIEKIGPFGFPFIGNARNLAPLIYVEDLAKAVYLSGMQSAAARMTFNITDGMRHTWYDFFSAFAVIMGKRLKILSLPPVLLRFPSLFLDLFSGLFGWGIDLTNYVNYLSHDVFFENSKAKKLLGWEPVHTDLAEGAGRMIEEHKGKKE